MDNNKIDEASKLIQLAIKDYNLFLKEINTYTPEKKAEALSWLRNALRYVNKKQTENNYMKKDIYSRIILLIIAIIFMIIAIYHLP